jgi:fructose-1,6-bisphosphatase/inositol monophosphatase family enzyme
LTTSHWPVIEGLFRTYDEIALAAFGKAAGEVKADGTTVTALDRQASKLVVERLREATPAFGILSEEEAEPHQMDAPWKWVIDPLDGTASFARGYPIWGLGIGLLHGTEPVQGYLRFSALRETLLCDGERMLWNGQPLVRREGPMVADSHNALIGSSLHGEIPYEKLSGFKLRNYGSNLYHLASLALGRADAVLSPRCYLWDFAAALPFTRAVGMIEVYLDGRPFDLGALLRPGAHFRTERPVLIGPPREVETLLKQLA